MAKQKPLVTQHLEKLSRDLLERYRTVLQKHIQNRQGIYALYRRGELYYVGLAGNLKQRLSTHLKDRHADSWDHFSVYLTIGDQHLRELESLLLRIVQTPGNKVKGKFARSENLLNKVKRDFSLEQKAEKKAVFGGGSAKAKPVAVPPKKSKATGKLPVLAKFISKSMKLRASFKHLTHWATVRKDGTISYKGKVYNSPSLAAIAAVERKSCNGWTFWQYQRSPGDWVLLDELRKK